MTREQFEKLPAWDGFDNRRQIRHDVGNWDMRKDTNGTIWYLTHAEGPEVNVWSPANVLDGYLYDMWRRGFPGFERVRREHGYI